MSVQGHKRGKKIEREIIFKVEKKPEVNETDENKTKLMIISQP